MLNLRTYITPNDPLSAPGDQSAYLNFYDDTFKSQTLASKRGQDLQEQPQPHFSWTMPAPSSYSVVSEQGHQLLLHFDLLTEILQ